MNELEFERLARRAAASVRDEADRVADSRSALATLLVNEPSLTTASEPLLVEPEPDRSRRRELWMPMLAAAAAAIVVGGIVLLARDDDGSIVVTTEPPTTVSEVTTVPQLVTPDEPPESTQPSPTTTLADVAPPSIDEPIVIHVPEAGGR